MSTRSLLMLAVSSLLIASGIGCARTAQFVSNAFEFVEFRVEQRGELAEVRQETQEQIAKERMEARQLASQRELQQLQADLDRQRMEIQFCQANMAQQQQQLQNQVKDVLQSKISFNAQHGLDVGELEVDLDELKKIIEKKEDEQNQPPGDSPQRALQKPCPCGDKLCGCEPALQKKHCRRCRHKSCDEEKDCGGPAAYQRALDQAQQQAQRGKLKPAEIPLKLPVRLSFGLGGPRIEQPQIQKVPTSPQTTPPDAPQTAPHQKPQQKVSQQPYCLDCVRGQCRLHAPFSHENRIGTLPPVPTPDR